jgi:hypothetical protein
MNPKYQMAYLNPKTKKNTDYHRDFNINQTY